MSDSPDLIPPAWLDHALGEEEIENVPAAFLARRLPGDEVWMYASPFESWQAHAGRMGYALVRAGRVTDVILTLQN